MHKSAQLQYPTHIYTNTHINQQITQKVVNSIYKLNASSSASLLLLNLKSSELEEEKELWKEDE